MYPLCILDSVFFKSTHHTHSLGYSDVQIDLKTYSLEDNYTPFWLLNSLRQAPSFNDKYLLRVFWHIARHNFKHLYAEIKA